MRKHYGRASAGCGVGEDPKKILDDVAKSWDATTNSVGTEKQKSVYAAWAAKSGAYPNKSER